MRVLRRLRTALPHEIRDRIKDTVVGDVYYSGPVQRSRARITDKHQISLPSPAGDLHLSVPPGDVLDRHADRNEMYEPSFSSGFIRTLNPDSVVYDVGSRWGYVSLLAVVAGVDPNSIHAFECDSFRATFCERNLPENASVLSKQVGSGSNGSLRLRDYATSNPAPDILKIDVEGHELAVLEGGSSDLLSGADAIFVEVHPTLSPDGTISKVFSHLNQASDEILTSLHRRSNGWQSISDPNYIEYDHTTPDPTAMLLGCSTSCATVLKGSESNATGGL